MRRIAVAFAISVALLGCAGPPLRTGGEDAAARERLLAELSSVADASGGRLGVSALHIESGRRIAFNAAERFPMASTFKVAVALKVLDQVDRRGLTLEQMIEIDGDHLSPGSGSLLKDVPAGRRKTLTLAQVLEVMMRESDNTATDLLLEKVGGPAAVTAHVRALGVGDLDVNRPAAQLVADSWGFTLPPAGARTRETLSRLHGRVPPHARSVAAAAFLRDARDTTTPDAMVSLLERLQRGAAIGPATTALLLDHMAKCTTGPRRLKGGVPPGTPVAHKTGTLTNVTTNDVGVVSLPWKRGHGVIAVFLTGSPRPIAEQERSIAQASRLVYEYFSR
jgi:beta-lactamase class A